MDYDFSMFKDDVRKFVEKNIKDVENFKSWIVKETKKELLSLVIIPKELSILEEEDKEKKVHVFVLIDDKVIKNPAEYKLNLIAKSVEKTKDTKVKPEIMLLSELWQKCFDGEYEILRIFTLGSIIHDTGMASALKIAEMHKIMVLDKFEKYVVSYVLAGSLIRGEATKTSDVDVFVVVDDTDVKRMSRFELKDKLRAIILEAAYVAGQKTKIENKLNVQVYILTEFWDSLKEANPVIYTFIRDGVPLYDRGVFMPWKQLLRMGMIQPSPEAVEKLMESGDKLLEGIQSKVNDMVTEDLYYAMLTPTQAAIMKYGISPPAPKETARMVREIFIEKEHLMDEKYVKMLEGVVKLRKDLEHGFIKEITVEDFKKYWAYAKQYLKRIKQLFSEIEERKDKEFVVTIYDDAISVVRNALQIKEERKVEEDKIMLMFEDELIKTGKLPQSLLRDFQLIITGYHNYTSGNFSKLDMSKIRQVGSNFIHQVVEYIQRESMKKFESVKITMSYADKVAELYPFETKIYFVPDIKDHKIVLVLDDHFKKVDEIDYNEFMKEKDTLKPKKLEITKELIDHLETLLNSKIKILL